MRPVRLLPAALLLAGALIAPGVAGAAPAVQGEFDLRERPHHLALGPDGNVWVTLDGVAVDVAKVEPDGRVTEYTVADITFPEGIAAGPDGNLWVTQTGGVVRFSPADPSVSRAFPVAAIRTAQGITAGPDGNLWTGADGNAVSITPAGTARLFPIAGLDPRGIARGADGNLYIADFGGGGRVVGLTTAGVPTFYATDGGPQEVSPGPDGMIGYTNSFNSPQQVGRFAPGGTVLRTTLRNVDPFGITLGDDGAWWTADFQGGTVSRFSATGEVTPLAGLSAGSGPRHITTGRGGTLWVGLLNSRRVARITGVVAPPPPTPPAPPAPPTPPAPPAPPRGDVEKPRLGVSLPRRVAVRRALTVKVTLNEPARLTLRLQRVSQGRRVGRNCVKQTRRLRRARRCERRANVLTRTLRGRSGANAIVVWRARGSRPAPGRFLVTVTATDAAGNRTPAIVKRFALVR